MANKDQSIITFKAEASLVDALDEMPNRSAFIRSAIISALNTTCPLCRGSGILTPEQKSHWDAFIEDHAVEDCGQCHQRYLVCQHEQKSSPHT
jgi:hypothetical protein